MSVQTLPPHPGLDNRLEILFVDSEYAVHPREGKVDRRAEDFRLLC